MDLNKKLQDKKNELYQLSHQHAQAQQMLNSTNTRLVQLAAEINLINQLINEQKENKKEK